jgi:hypothetical protein
MSGRMLLSSRHFSSSRAGTPVIFAFAVLGGAELLGLREVLRLASWC